jgi:hypothetical protein
MGSALQGGPGPSGLENQVASHAELCSSVLREARQLVVTGRFGPALGQLIARATDLLDEIDEALVGLNPIRHPAAFASAAALHREMEYIHAHTLADRRGRARPAVRET